APVSHGETHEPLQKTGEQSPHRAMHGHVEL
ncbi:MAG: hypothetical protein ACI9HE_000397, partial [Planctomycetota bacterium]